MLFQSKEVIRERERAKYTLKNLPAGLTLTWQQYMLKRQYEDFCHCVAQVSIWGWQTPTVKVLNLLPYPSIISVYFSLSIVYLDVSVWPGIKTFVYIC